MGEWLNRPPSREAAKKLINMSLEDKVYQTCVNISDWDIFTGGKWYISFSGGKDSTVLAYIAAKLLNGSPIPRTLYLLFCDTGLEYPEIRKFVFWYAEWLQKRFKKVTVELQVQRPKKHFFEVIRENGYPVIGKEVAQAIWEAKRADGKKYSYRIARLNGELRDKNGELSKFNIPQYKYLVYAPYYISHKCCVLTKKEPASTYERKNKLKPVVATMAGESEARKTAWLVSGCNAYEGKRPQSKPMSFWNEQNVLQYKVQEGIPFCSVYGEVLPFDGENYYEKTLFDIEKGIMCQDWKCTGCQRTGCVFCGFGAHLEKPGEQRFVRLKETHPKHWNYAINGGEWDPADGMWKPSKTPGHVGLGMGRVLDYIGVPYE